MLCACLGLDCAALSVRKVTHRATIVRREFPLPTTNYNASPMWVRQGSKDYKNQRTKSITTDDAMCEIFGCAMACCRSCRVSI